MPRCICLKNRKQQSILARCLRDVFFGLEQRVYDRHGEKKHNVVMPAEIFLQVFFCDFLDSAYCF